MRKIVRLRRYTIPCTAYSYQITYNGILDVRKTSICSCVAYVCMCVLGGVCMNICACLEKCQMHKLTGRRLMTSGIRGRANTHGRTRLHTHSTLVHKLYFFKMAESRQNNLYAGRNSQQYFFRLYIPYLRSVKVSFASHPFRVD